MTTLIKIAAIIAVIFTMNVTSFAQFAEGSIFRIYNGAGDETPIKFAFLDNVFVTPTSDASLSIEGDLMVFKQGEKYAYIPTDSVININDYTHRLDGNMLVDVIPYREGTRYNLYIYTYQKELSITEQLRTRKYSIPTIASTYDLQVTAPAWFPGTLYGTAKKDWIEKVDAESEWPHGMFLYFRDGQITVSSGHGQQISFNPKVGSQLIQTDDYMVSIQPLQSGTIKVDIKAKLDGFSLEDLIKDTDNLYQIFGYQGRITINKEGYVCEVEFIERDSSVWVYPLSSSLGHTPKYNEYVAAMELVPSIEYWEHSSRISFTQFEELVEKLLL